MSLARIQLISLVTKAITTLLGIAQSLIIVRLLSPDQFGLIGLVMSIGGAIGVSQHLGIVDGAIREIAILKKQADASKVIWVSLLVRQVVTIPLSLALFVFAEVIAVSVYHRPEIIPYIRLFAGVLILQGFQDVLGAALTGMKKFTGLYLIQIITATLNIAIFGTAIWLFGTAGFFYAVTLTTALMATLFVVLIVRTLGHSLAIPRAVDVKSIGRRLMKIGAYMYVARICFVLWQRLPLLLLGGVLASEQLGFINVALSFGTRLTIIAAALSEVNLSWMSSLFASKRHAFDAIVANNMRRVFLLMTALTAAIIFFVPEILTLVGASYAPAEAFIYVLTLAFFLYSLLDVGTSSLFVAANDPRSRTGIYLTMTALPAIIIAGLFITAPTAFGACVAVLAGVLVSYALMLGLGKRKYNISLINRTQLFLFALLIGSTIWLQQDPALGYRLLIFTLFIGYIFYQLIRFDLVPAMLAKGRRTASARMDHRAIICFAGATYDQPSWTNRQHMMSRIANQIPVLYVEPRIWLFRYIATNWRQPRVLMRFFRRLIGVERVHDKLFIKAQWNLLPFSREYRQIAKINWLLNRWSVRTAALQLGFSSPQTIIWLYDTEGVEYLRDFAGAYVLYDCVDDHAAQAGVDRNPSRVIEEEEKIMQRANVVTVTSTKLYELKRQGHPNVHLVLNAGDVEAFSNKSPGVVDVPARIRQLPHPIIGSVGALDRYKVDFELLYQVARQHPDWQFVCIGEPMVDRDQSTLTRLRGLPNVYLLGAVDHRLVPAYVSFFDICTIPYRSSRYNEASFPLKFWEFMATGKPIIVSGLPELRAYQSLIHYVTTVDEYSMAVTKSLQESGSGSAKRRAVAAEHSWQHRVDQIMALLPS